MQAPKFHYVGPQYRATFREQEIVRRKKMARKKEEKMKAKEESKLKSVWNVDNEICDELELNFRLVYSENAFLKRKSNSVLFIPYFVSKYLWYFK